MSIPDQGGGPGSLRRRFAPLLLLAGAAGAAFVVLPSVPHEHHVDLRLDDAASVTGVDVAWTSTAAAATHATLADEEALRGVSWHFQAGRAPATLGAAVTLPDGRYALDVTVQRGTEAESFHRVLTLGDADSIAVPLRRGGR
jgi:hypothetical protein